MKNYTGKFFILCASVIVGFLIITNIGMGKTNGIFNLNLNSVQYRDAVEERNALYDEISILSDDNYELKKKVESFDIDEIGSEKVIDNMREQTIEYSVIAGITEVTGPGIVLTISDGDYDIYSDNQVEVDRRTLHSSDAALVLNEIRAAGAEAISINNYRIVNTTGLECAWAFIRFEDDEMEGSPFKFYALGDPDHLEEALYAEGSHINQLLLRKLNVDIEKFDEITFSISSKSLSPTFMERADN